MLGSYTAVSKRPSLGDNYLGHDHRGNGRRGITQLPRISCKSVPADLCAMSQGSADQDGGGAENGGSLLSAVEAGVIRSGSSSSSTKPAKAPSSPVPAGISRLSNSSSINNNATSSSSFSASSLQQLQQLHLAPPPFAESAAALAAAASMPSPLGDLPPAWFTDRLAGELRRRLGMDLFNFDLLRIEEPPQEQQKTPPPASGGVSPPKEVLFYVIDINYFPGVDKIAMFEERCVCCDCGVVGWGGVRGCDVVWGAASVVCLGHHLPCECGVGHHLACGGTGFQAASWK